MTSHTNVLDFVASVSTQPLVSCAVLVGKDSVNETDWICPRFLSCSQLAILIYSAPSPLFFQHSFTKCKQQWWFRQMSLIHWSVISQWRTESRCAPSCCCCCCFILFCFCCCCFYFFMWEYHVEKWESCHTIKHVWRGEETRTFAICVWNSHWRGNWTTEKQERCNNVLCTVINKHILFCFTPVCGCCWKTDIDLFS